MKKKKGKRREIVGAPPPPPSELELIRRELAIMHSVLHSSDCNTTAHQRTQRELLNDIASSMQIMIAEARHHSSDLRDAVADVSWAIRFAAQELKPRPRVPFYRRWWASLVHWWSWRKVRKHEESYTVRVKAAVVEHETRQQQEPTCGRWS